MTTKFVYAANIIKEIENIEKQANSATSIEENTTLMNKIEQLRLIIKDVVLTYYYNGYVKREMWVKDGKIHRSDGAPADIEYSEFNRMISESWYTDGKLHRIDGPAVIGYFVTGQVQYERWYKDGAYHRIDGPAVISYFRNILIPYESWYTTSIETGRVEHEAWYTDGKLHRVDAPAVISYFENGRIEWNMRYINGKFYSFIDDPLC